MDVDIPVLIKAQYKQFQHHLSQQGYESQSIPYQRGDILDSKGTILATSVDVYNLVLDCKVINEEFYDSDKKKKVKKYLEPTVAALLQCFPDVTEEEIMAALTEKADSRYFVLRKKLHYQEIVEFQDFSNGCGHSTEGTGAAGDSESPFSLWCLNQRKKAGGQSAGDQLGDSVP